MEIIMEILYYIAGCFWLIGWIAQVADINAKAYRSSVEPPFYGAFVAIYVMLFFTWPYWYFYTKSASK